MKGTCCNLYMCLRGVTLDVVPDRSEETFLNSLRKFISSKLLSNNGGVFVPDITQKCVSSCNVKSDSRLKETPWFG